MPRYMLDTDTCSYIMRRSPEAVVRRLSNVPVSDVCISVITKAELLYGVEVSPKRKQDEAAVAAFVDGLAHFGLGWSWGGFESLIVPAHIKRTASAFPAKGPILRIHAGLEDAGDLIADLEKGLQRLKDRS